MFHDEKEAIPMKEADHGFFDSTLLNVMLHQLQN
jgi:hypothetical protein